MKLIDEIVEFKKEYGGYFKEYSGRKFKVKAISYRNGGDTLLEDIETLETKLVDVLWLNGVR